MDIKEQITKVINALTADGKLETLFKTNPSQVVSKILGGGIPSEIIEKIVDGVKAKLKLKAAGDKAEDIAEDAKNALDGLGKLFKK